jgi:hypothetical protein
MQDDSYVNHMLKYKKDNKEELVKKFEAKHGGGDKKQVPYHSGECRVADPRS